MAVRIEGGGEFDGAILRDAATADLQQQIINALGGVARNVQDGNTQREREDMGFIRNLGTDAISAAGDAVTGGLRGTVGTLAGVTGNLIQGNYQLSDQTKILSDSFSNLNLDSGIVGGAFATLAGGTNQAIRFIQETADTFRGMSDVGGGLAGDLISLRTAAAQTRMPLDEFAGMVTENSSKLLAFGSSVDEGTRAFVETSRAFFDSRLGLAVQGLGIGFEETNQLMMDYMDTQRRNERFQQMDERERAAAAQSYIFELDTLSKLTGKSRKELQDEARQRLRQGQTQAALRQIEARTGQDVTTAYQEMAREINGTLGPGFGDMFDSMVALNGAIDPTNEAMKGLYAAAPEAAETMSQAARAFNAGDIDTARRLQEQAQAQALQRMNSDEYLSVARLGALGGAVGQASSDLIEENQDFLDAVRGQIEATDRASASVDQFATALNQARENIMIQQAETIDSPTMGAVVAGETVIRDASAAMISTLDTTFRPGIENVLTDLRDGIRGIDVEGEIRNLFRTASGMVSTQDINSVISDLEGIAADPEASERTVEVTQALIDGLEEHRTALESGTTTREEREAIAASVAQIRAVAANDIQTLNESLTESTSSTLERTGNSVVEGIRELFNGGVEFNAPDANFPNANFTNAPVTAGPDDSSRPGMSSGTVGEFGRLFADFGQETIAALHGREMVATPEQLQAGLASFAENLLGAGGGFMPRMSDSITTSANQPTQQNIEMPDLTQIVDGIRQALQENSTETSEMLNNKLSELTGYAARQLDVNTRHLKASRNLSGNMFRGLGF